jgi:hypothetical protein
MKYWQPYGITDPDAPYINGDPSIGRAGSIPPAGAFEQDQREIVNTIIGAAMTPTETDVRQLLVAVRSQRMNYAVATNTVPNAIAVSFYPPIGDQATPGMPLRIKAPFNNTGPCTLIVDNSQHPLKRADGAELVLNDIIANVPFECMWADAGYWIVTNFRGIGASGGGGDTINNTYLTKIPYTTDIGTPNHIIANFTPPITAPVPGDAIEVRLANNITGAAGIIINGLAEVAVVRPNGASLVSGDGAVDQVALLLRGNDGKWQFASIVPAVAGATGYPLPVGSLLFTLGNVPLPGCLKLNGSLINRADHPKLWDFANTTGRIVDESVWQNASGRQWTAFSRGDGTTTFRVPELRGEFLRMWDDGRGVDPSRLIVQQQADMFASHTHNVVITWTNIGAGGGSWSGSIGTISGAQAGLSGIEGGNWTHVINGFITDMGGIAYAAGGSETRPRNAVVMPCIVDG